MQFHPSTANKNPSCIHYKRTHIQRDSKLCFVKICFL